MNKLATIALTALVATTAIVGTARGAKANPSNNVCHATAMRVSNIAQNVRSHGDARRMHEEMGYYKNLGCAQRSNTTAAERNQEIQLILKAIDFVCYKGYASC